MQGRAALRRTLAVAAMALGMGLAAAAQSNEFMDRLLGAKAASFGQAAYLVLAAADKIGADADETAAFAALQSMKLAPKGATATAPVRLDQFAYILVRAFGIKGGIMERLAPSPRYAYRELAYEQVIQGDSDPAMRVSGLLAVQMLGRVMDASGAAQ